MKHLILTILLFCGNTFANDSLYKKIIVGKTTEEDVIKLNPNIVMSRQKLTARRLCKGTKEIIIYSTADYAIYIDDITGLVCNKRK